MGERVECITSPSRFDEFGDNFAYDGDLRSRSFRLFDAMASVILEDLYKSFSRRQGGVEKDDRQLTVLRRINLTVRDGEFMVLVGPSGCGKSTLLRLIAGLEMPSAGNIWIGDRLVNNIAPKLRNTAIVFQNYALYPHLTVYDNLAFGLRRLPGSPAQKAPNWEAVLSAATRSLPDKLRYVSTAEKSIRHRVLEVAKMLQIETLLDRVPKQLSGGQKQRVALGRAISRSPDVFLMDEPLSNLDAKLRGETRSQIVQLQRQLGITTIYVTHDRTEAMTMGDRIAVMNEGRIQQIAPPLDIYDRPANCFVAEFMGSPTTNFLTVQVESSQQIACHNYSLTLPVQWEKSLQLQQGRSLLMGVRPEHFYLAADDPNSLVGEVEFVEILGSDTYLTVRLETASQTVQVRVPPERTRQIGDRVCLAIDADKVRFFDADTREAI